MNHKLASDYGNRFNEKNLRRMMQFAEIFPDEQIVVSLIRQLSWTHFIYLSSIIKRYAPIALRMNLFFEELMKKTKQEPYPADELDELWNQVILKPIKIELVKDN